MSAFRVLILAATLASGCSAAAGTEAAPALAAGEAEAIFAGGCFWCMEKPFDTLPGVVSTTSGYTGGQREHPTYKQVSAGGTKHAEAIRVVYDPQRVRYDELLVVFWHNIDPTQSGGQFCDLGNQYRSEIFTSTPEERAAAEASRRQISQTIGQPVVTEISQASTFWLAEEYHQDFYKKDPQRYASYRRGCGRDRRLLELWGPAH